MTAVDLLALADRIEGALEGSRELDARIHTLHLWGDEKQFAEWDGVYVTWTADGRFAGRTDHVPGYTSSIDAALTLVPDTRAWYVRRNCSPDREDIYCNAKVWRYCDPRDDDEPIYWANSGEHTPALAICAAALRARAAMMQET